MEPILPDERSFNSYHIGQGIMRGIVSEVKDVDNINILEVDLVGYDRKLPCVHVMSEVAHKASGKVVIPSVGDEVLVAFINNDETQPVVIGSVYNSKNVQPFTADAHNMVMHMTLPSGKASNGKAGTKIEISCEEKKQKITITSEKGHVIEYDDDKETGTIKAKNGKTSFTVDITNGKIELKAAEIISMQVGNNKMELNGQEVNISGAKVVVGSTGETKIGGKMIAVDSEVDTKVGGAKVAVNAKGILELKGNMTKIN